MGSEMGLDKRNHGSLSLWAADCTEHVLPCFEEERPKDDQPRNAVEAGRAWARGEIAMGEARVSRPRQQLKPCGRFPFTAHTWSIAADTCSTGETRPRGRVSRRSQGFAWL
jgi:immunity protein 5 of polymorphic toxin system